MGERARGRERDGAFWHLNYISIASDTREEWRKERKKEGGREGGGTANHHLDVYFNFTVFGWHLKNSNLCACDMCSLNMAARKERVEKWYSCYLTSAKKKKHTHTHRGDLVLEAVFQESQTSRVFFRTLRSTNTTHEAWQKGHCNLTNMTAGSEDWRPEDDWEEISDTTCTMHDKTPSFWYRKKKSFSFISSAALHRFMWRRRTMKAKGVKNEPPSIHLSRKHFHPLSHLIIPLQALLSYF